MRNSPFKRLQRSFLDLFCKALSLGVFLAGIGSVGAFASDFQSARTAALGGSGHAGPLLTDALFLNPSFVTFIPNTVVTGSMGSPQGLSPVYSLAIQDGHSDFFFQAGVAYTRRRDVQLVTFGASKSVVRRLGFGLSGKYALPWELGRPAFGDSTLSMTFLALDWLQLSLTLDNLIELESARRFGFYRELVFGSKFNVLGIALVYLDPHWTPSLPTSEAFGVEAGLELPVLKDLYLRAGTFVNANLGQQLARGSGFGLGAGWMAPRLSLDYGFQRALNLNRTGGSSDLHQVSLSVFF